MAETIIRENLGKLLYFVKIKKKKRNFNFFLVEKFENKNFQLEEKVIYIYTWNAIYHKYSKYAKSKI